MVIFIYPGLKFMTGLNQSTLDLKVVLWDLRMTKTPRTEMNEDNLQKMHDFIKENQKMNCGFQNQW